jgi:hypothetical protein
MGGNFGVFSRLLSEVVPSRLDPSPTIPSLVQLFVPMHLARGRLVAPPADGRLLRMRGVSGPKGRTPPAGAPATPEATSRSGVRHSPRLFCHLRLRRCRCRCTAALLPRCHRRRAAATATLSPPPPMPLRLQRSCRWLVVAPLVLVGSASLLSCSSTPESVVVARRRHHHLPSRSPFVC